MAASRGVCEVCQSEPSIYCCPKCGLRSCSLTCVTSHKLERNCDGIRDRTAYVPLNNFDDLTLLSDYRFLEETARCVNNANRNEVVSEPKSIHDDGRLPYLQHRLVVECRNRGINLEIMPKSFQRRCANTTFFKIGERKLYWHMEWSFPQAETTYTDDRIAEDCTLSVAIEKYLNSERSDPSVSQRLVYYQSAGYGGVVPLLKAERLRSKESKYYELDFSETIAANLESKTIIEFPTIVVVLKEHLHCYSIIEDDEDDKEEVQLTMKKKKRRRTNRKRKEEKLSEGECSTTSDGDG